MLPGRTSRQCLPTRFPCRARVTSHSLGGSSSRKSLTKIIKQKLRCLWAFACVFRQRSTSCLEQRCQLFDLLPRLGELALHILDLLLDRFELHSGAVQVILELLLGLVLVSLSPPCSLLSVTIPPDDRRILYAHLRRGQ